MEEIGRFFIIPFKVPLLSMVQKHMLYACQCEYNLLQCCSQGGHGVAVPHHELLAPFHGPRLSIAPLGEATDLPLLCLLSQRKGGAAAAVTFLPANKQE